MVYLKKKKKNGIESYIVEQDVSALTGGMLESMAVSLENLIKLSEQLQKLFLNNSYLPKNAAFFIAAFLSSVFICN